MGSRWERRRSGACAASGVSRGPSPPPSARLGIACVEAPAPEAASGVSRGPTPPPSAHLGIACVEAPGPRGLSTSPGRGLQSHVAFCLNYSGAECITN